MVVRRGGSARDYKTAELRYMNAAKGKKSKGVLTGNLAQERPSRGPNSLVAIKARGQVFRPEAKLDPSQVTDLRSRPGSTSPGKRETSSWTVPSKGRPGAIGNQGKSGLGPAKPTPSRGSIPKPGASPPKKTPTFRPGTGPSVYKARTSAQRRKAI